MEQSATPELISAALWVVGDSFCTHQWNCRSTHCPWRSCSKLSPGVSRVPLLFASRLPALPLKVRGWPSWHPRRCKTRPVRPPPWTERICPNWVRVKAGMDGWSSQFWVKSSANTPGHLLVLGHPTSRVSLRCPGSRFQPLEALIRIGQRSRQAPPEGKYVLVRDNDPEGPRLCRTDDLPSYVGTYPCTHLNEEQRVPGHEIELVILVVRATVSIASCSDENFRGLYTSMTFR